MLAMLVGNASRADEQKPGVSLILSKVTAERWEQETVFRCQVTLDNDTSQDLSVISNFYSAFDGLELVVTNAHGKVLLQQHYLSHQSPSTPDGREFVVKRGKTTDTIVFPVRSFGTVGDSIRVRVVGTLPRSSYRRILSTDTIRTVIKKNAG